MTARPHALAAACAYNPPPMGHGYPVPPEIRDRVRRGPWGAYVKVQNGLLVPRTGSDLLPLPEPDTLRPIYAPDLSLLPEPVPIREARTDADDVLRATPDGQPIPLAPHTARRAGKRTGIRVTVRAGVPYRGRPDIPKGHVEPPQRDAVPEGTAHFYLRPGSPRQDGERYDLCGNRTNYRYLPAPVPVPEDLRATLHRHTAHARVVSDHDAEHVRSFLHPDTPVRVQTNTKETNR